jgi:hypothetical protein
MYYFKRIYIGELIGVETNISESKNRGYMQFEDSHNKG